MFFFKAANGSYAPSTISGERMLFPLACRLASSDMRSGPSWTVYHTTVFDGL